MDQPSKSIGKFVCPICTGATFTEEEYLEEHKKISKTHKKLAKKLKGKIYKKDTVDLTLETSEETTSTEFIDTNNLPWLWEASDKREFYREKGRKKFKDGYVSYIYSTIAYWTTNLVLNPTVQDFKITLNDKNWDPFGDVVVEVQYKELLESPATNIRYVMQFKHIISSSILTIESFSDGIFSFKDFAEQIGKIKKQDQIDETRFYVFTTAVPGPHLKTLIKVSCCDECQRLKVVCICSKKTATEGVNVDVLAKPLSNKNNLSFNSSEENGSVYRLFSIAGNDWRLPNIYMFTSQKSLRHLATGIDEIVSNFLEGTQSKVARELIKFIEWWAEETNNVHFRLRKKDVMLIIAELLLTPFKITPKIKSIEEPGERFAIWTQAVKSVDVTVLKHPESDLSQLLEPFNLAIEKHLGLKIIIASDCDDYIDCVKISRTKERNDLEKIENLLVKSYILEETPNNVENEISLEKLYKIFWKSGLMPMVLQVDKVNDQAYIFQVINLLKRFGLNRKYFVSTTDKTIKKSIKMWKNLSFFLHVGNISGKLGPTIMNNVKINIMSAPPVSLGMIQETDTFFQKSISPYEFFDMTLGKFQFKPFSYLVGQREHDNTKLILDDELMEALRRAVESSINIDQNDYGTTIIINDPTEPLRGVNPELFA